MERGVIHRGVKDDRQVVVVRIGTNGLEYVDAIEIGQYAIENHGIGQHVLAEVFDGLVPALHAVELMSPPLKKARKDSTGDRVILHQQKLRHAWFPMTKR